MKRFHVHLHVNDLSRSIGSYSRLFDATRTRVESDYAEWMLQDPPLNFAISTRGAQPGIDHLGIQTDDAAELGALKARAEAGNLVLFDEGKTTCCYARSEKHWINDPQGIAWEHFRTLDNIPAFREDIPAEPASALMRTGRAVGSPRTGQARPGGGDDGFDLLLLRRIMSDKTYSVLFLCTGNPARSILAEALTNHLGAPRFKAWSAGSFPKWQVNPFALSTLAEWHIPQYGLRSKSWDEFAAPGAPPLDS